MILDASLDTSFWNRASAIGIAPYLFHFFRVHYCAAVKGEIITTDPKETALIYPQAMLFRVFEEDGRLMQTEPSFSMNRFGVGEAFATALAFEKGWPLLINDSRPLQFARTLNISCVCVPDFCVMLFVSGRITLAAAQGYLKRLTPTTAQSLLEQAERMLLLAADSAAG